MDTLAYIGRKTATFQLVAGSLVAILLIVIGVLMLISASKGQQPSTDPNNPSMSVEMKTGIGIGLIIFGIIIPYGSWMNRKLVRGNSKYAAFDGGFFLFRMFS